MSKIGRKPIKIPHDVQVAVQGRQVSIKGPKGNLALRLDPLTEVRVAGEILTVDRQAETKQARALQGTIHRLIWNMIQGVKDGFERRLIIEGIGFKAAVQGPELVMELGFSNPVKLPTPAGLEVKVDRSLISLRGIDKQRVGEFAALIRRQRPPDAYKGKGIRYEDEVLRLKPGKKAAVAAT